MSRQSGLLCSVLAVSALVLLGSPAAALKIRAQEAGIYNLDTGRWIYSKLVDKQVPVASLTKVATALTFLAMSQDLDQLVTITRKDWIRSGRTPLRIGDRVPVRTLLRLALVASDNCAARALTHPFGLSWEAFGYKMQEMAWGLGCRKTVFVEPTGLDAGNVSSVRDIVLLFSKALENPDLREILGTSKFTLETERGPRRIAHSSRLLRYRKEVRAAKTGYLAAAGYCLVQYVENTQGTLITVVLGTSSKRARTRESTRLMDYARRNPEKKSRDHIPHLRQFYDDISMIAQGTGTSSN